MKKILAGIVAALLGASLCLGASACGGHIHEFPDSWTTVTEANCLHEGKKVLVCKTCGYTMEETIPMTAHTFRNYTADAEYHWRECLVCKQRLEYAPHSMSGDLCTVCKYSTVGTQSLQYKFEDGNTYTVTGIAGTIPAQVVIPENYLGYPVTAIGEGAFRDQQTIESVVLPANLTEIGGKAFSGCRRLTSLLIPAKVTSIGGGAFEGCSSLASITVEPANPMYSSQEGILFDKSVTKFIHVPAALTGKVTLPSAFTELPNGVYSGHTGITEVVLHGQVTKIDELALRGCTGLEQLVVPANVVSIGKSALEGCTSLNRLVLPRMWQDDVTEPLYDPTISSWNGNSFIGYLFGTVSYYDNKNKVPDSLKTIEFTGGTSIKKYLLYGCKGLERVILPATVTEIDTSAFDGCSSLKAVEVAAENKEYFTADGILYNGTKTGILFVPAAITGKITVPEGVMRIEERTFRGLAIEEISLPESLRSIGKEAFSDCTSLQTVTIPEESRLVSFGDYSFFKCEKLRSILIPASVQTIGQFAFGGCIALGTAYFRDTNSWQRSLTTDMQNADPAIPARLADPEDAADELSDRYAAHFWRKG